MSKRTGEVGVGSWSWSRDQSAKESTTAPQLGSPLLEYALLCPVARCPLWRSPCWNIVIVIVQTVRTSLRSLGVRGEANR